jgi:hypothetical protein
MRDGLVVASWGLYLPIAATLSVSLHDDGRGDVGGIGAFGWTGTLEWRCWVGGLTGKVTYRRVSMSSIVLRGRKNAPESLTTT